eukprot:1158271-Pelagomonas_calceolata.AAC.6
MCASLVAQHTTRQPTLEQAHPMFKAHQVKKGALADLDGLQESKDREKGHNSMFQHHDVP